MTEQESPPPDDPDPEDRPGEPLASPLDPSDELSDPLDLGLLTVDELGESPDAGAAIVPADSGPAEPVAAPEGGGADAAESAPRLDDSAGSVTDSREAAADVPALLGEDGDGVSAAAEQRAARGGDGNRDGIADALQADVASLRAAGGTGVTVEAAGHELRGVRVRPAPSDGPNLPLGMFAFDVHGVPRGGAATVRLFLPEGFAANAYFKQDASGAFYDFAFDGTTGAEFAGNGVTLHLVDGGRGDADGVANGVIVDPGGPGWYSVVTAAKVREVTFSGDDLIKIHADPNTIEYPDGPQWLDTNDDGLINVPGDVTVPIGYPRNSDVVVSARFTATIQNQPWPPSNYNLMVMATNAIGHTARPISFVVPPTSVTLVDGKLVLPPTTVTNPFPDHVNYGTLTLYWLFSNDGGFNWYEAGWTDNELYVPLRGTTETVYHTPIHLSVPISSGPDLPSDEATVIAQTWKNFEARTLVTQSAYASQTGKPITYYKEWDTQAQDVDTLLDGTNNRDRDGQCAAFVLLFRNALRCAGVRDTPLIPILVESFVNEGLLIKTWGSTGNGTANVVINGKTYPFQNTLADPTQDPRNSSGGVGSFTRKNAQGVWEYYWGSTVEVSDYQGQPGQNTSNPKSHFSNHALLDIGGTYYDPSYGTKFNSLLAWEDASVAGFVTVEALNTNPVQYRLVFRGNPAGADIRIL